MNLADVVQVAKLNSDYLLILYGILVMTLKFMYTALASKIAMVPLPITTVGKTHA